jgi:hypothetical protein
MTQGLEQYHLTHLKISLIYLLNLRYKVLKYKVLIYDFPYLPRYKPGNSRRPVFVDDKNHEQDTSHVYLIIIFISPLEIGVTHIEVPLNFHFIKLSSKLGSGMHIDLIQVLSRIPIWPESLESNFPAPSIKS